MTYGTNLASDKEFKFSERQISEKKNMSEKIFDH